MSDADDKIEDEVKRIADEYAARKFREMPEAADGQVFAVLPGTDGAGLIYEGMNCFFCKRAVEPGTGAQAFPPFLPAMHGTCMTEAARQLGFGRSAKDADENRQPPPEESDKPG